MKLKCFLQQQRSLGWHSNWFKLEVVGLENSYLVNVGSWASLVICSGFSIVEICWEMWAYQWSNTGFMVTLNNEDTLDGFNYEENVIEIILCFHLMRMVKW